MEGLSQLLWSTPMKIMPLFALAGLLAVPAHARAAARASTRTPVRTN
jgi:hypothetical protein